VSIEKGFLELEFEPLLETEQVYAYVSRPLTEWSSYMRQKIQSVKACAVLATLFFICKIAVHRGSYLFIIYS
jgi:hypothetical protein